jgi:glycerophosphoryl diester phosphodiesterase
MNILLDLVARPVIAHRGASGHAPENTLQAFELAMTEGADAFELDVRLSHDGAPVVMHDASLNRTTNRTGPVRSHALVDLQTADAGFRFTTDGGRTFPFRGTGVRIPTLDEVLRTFPRIPMLIEIKEPEVQAAVQEILVAEGATRRCVLASEHQEALRLFLEPPFARAASGHEISALYRAVLLRRPLPHASYQLLSVPDKYRLLTVPTSRFVAAARSLGCPVDVWTVNETATARALWARGVAGIVTNLPAAIRAVRPSP